ncbi:hypothetical protein LWE61_12155 [Sphingobium sufflavum]|nr:hypothetical protein [Sphingobium sufflavum]MCE7797309.1 hypothetical protein [Sphingobium sufflavum]
MGNFDPPHKEIGSLDRLDPAFSELSRALGPMSLVFSFTGLGWLLLHLV